MKKVGIVTFHASYNCGSILQGMALQTILKDRIGVNPEIIDFSNKNQKALYSVLYKKLTLKNIVKNMLCIPGYKHIKQHYEDYENYIRTHFILSEGSYENTDELIGIEKNYDALICGSDQIWNVNCDDGDDAYFLSFAKNIKKVAYAPSLGAVNIANTPIEQKYRDFLMDFSALSVREENGKAWLESLTKRNVDLLLDPTLLLDKADWEKFIEPCDEIPSGQFIFYYAFSFSQENNRAVAKLARELQMPVIIIESKQWYIKGLSRYKEFHLTTHSSPNYFLNMMKNAACVITTSFHGSAFSTIFGKKFLYIKGEKHDKQDDRTEGLLRRLRLLRRHVTVDQISKERLLEDIEYDSVHTKIKELKKGSIAYLDKNLND